ncbi:MAG: efflux RND transporter periplasmic adaptor subunit [bacterium]
MKKKIKNIFKKPIVYIPVGIIILGLIIYLIFGHKSSPYQFVKVVRDNVTEAVTVTGNTTPVSNVNLSFESGGTVAGVYHDVGSTVSAGDTIVSLDKRDLSAQYAQAQAAVDAQQAKLDSLQAGSRPEDIQVSQAALSKSQQDLANLYSSVANTLNTAYSSAFDAYSNQLSGLFNNSNGGNPQFALSANNSQAASVAQTALVNAHNELTNWQTEISNIPVSVDQASLDNLLVQAGGHLAVVQDLMRKVFAIVTDPGTSASSVTALTAYKSSVSVGLNEVNAAISSINTTTQGIASEKAVVDQAQAALALKQAGSSAQDIAAEKAQVEQAQANLDSIGVKLSKASLISPIAGVVTVQNAKAGQVASPGQVIATVISVNNLEVDALVPEADIGKIAVGNKVDMTLDAFPGETFTGNLFYIDPAQTITGGVVDFKIKVSFDKADTRLKSGLTTNLTIKSKEADNVLVLPQYAILQTDQGTFVEVLQNGKVVQVPVTTGIQDAAGKAEILTGVTEGEQVINVGLK